MLQVSFIGFAGSATPGSSWNPADKSPSITLAESNFLATASSGADGGVRGVQFRATGARYCEMKIVGNVAGLVFLGFATSAASFSDLGTGPGAVGVLTEYRASDGNILSNEGGWALNNTFGFRWDAVGGVVQVYKNGATYGSGILYPAGSSLAPFVGMNQAGTSVRLLTAASKFAYPIPSGAVAWD